MRIGFPEARLRADSESVITCVSRRPTFVHPAHTGCPGIIRLIHWRVQSLHGARRSDAPALVMMISSRTNDRQPVPGYSALSTTAAWARATNLRLATLTLFIGRLEKVPKPQSGLRKMRSDGRYCSASLTRSTIALTGSVSGVRGLT